MILVLVLYLAGIVVGLVIVGYVTARDARDDYGVADDRKVLGYIVALTWPVGLPFVGLLRASVGLVALGKRLRLRAPPKRRDLPPQEPVCPNCKSRGAYR